MKNNFNFYYFRLAIKTFILFVLLIIVPNVSYANLPITSPFGWREHPIDRQLKFHAGLDLGYDEGTPIPAMFNGQVVFSGNYGGLGNAIYIYHHDSNTYTGYGHCKALVAKAGQYVSQGDVIAYVGNTGYSTGPHLHLEYIVSNGSQWVYEDPLKLWQ